MLGFPRLVGVKRKAKNYHQGTKAPRNTENQFNERCGREPVRLKRIAFPLTAHLPAE
jgi:hypothetical protein